MTTPEPGTDAYQDYLADLYDRAWLRWTTHAEAEQLPTGGAGAYASWYCYRHQGDHAPHRIAIPEYIREMTSHWRREMAAAEQLGDEAEAAEHRERLEALGTLIR